MVNRYNNMRTNVHRGTQRNNNNTPSCSDGYQRRANDSANENRMNERLNNGSLSNGGCGFGLDRSNERNTCGDDCRTLMRRLQTIDFSIVDTVLYLDAYPECGKALAYYNKLVEERESIRMALAKKCRRPMSSFENASDCSWDWINSPWPWEASAN